MFCDPPSCFASPDGCTSLGWEKNIRLTAPALFTEILDDAVGGGGGDGAVLYGNYGVAEWGGRTLAFW